MGLQDYGTFQDASGIARSKDYVGTFERHCNPLFLNLIPMFWKKLLFGRWLRQKRLDERKWTFVGGTKNFEVLSKSVCSFRISKISIEKNSKESEG